MWISPLAEILAAAPGPAHDGRRPLPTFLQVVQTVAYAHAHGVVHCDLTPSNVMVGEYGEVQVMDWGLARTAPRGAGTGKSAGIVIGTGPAPPDANGNPDAGGVLVGDDRVMGTPGYMAPEQVDGTARPIDARVDVFARTRDDPEARASGHRAYLPPASRSTACEMARGVPLPVNKESRPEGCAEFPFLRRERPAMDRKGAPGPSATPPDGGKMSHKVSLAQLGRAF